MNPIDSLLVAVDFTPACEGAIERARWLASHGQVRRIIIVHVLDVRLLDGVARLGVTTRSEFEQRSREAAETSLAELADRLRIDSTVAVATECRCGLPAEQLAAAVRQHAPSLVVAGRSHRGWRQVVLGSTARRMLRAIEQALWLVRRDDEPKRMRILIASDLRPAAARAARLASRLWPEAQFELLYVVEYLPDMVAGLVDAGSGDAASVRADLERQSRQRVQAFADEHLAGRDLTVRLESGHPVTMVMARAQAFEADLLVLGRSGRHGVEAVVLGSVAEALLERVDCDVLLAPAGAAT